MKPAGVRVVAIEGASEKGQGAMASALHAAIRRRDAKPRKPIDRDFILSYLGGRTKAPAHAPAPEPGADSTSLEHPLEEGDPRHE